MPLLEASGCLRTRRGVNRLLESLSDVMNAPNILSLLRLALAPFVVWLLFQGRMQEALLWLVVAALTDGVDGYLARRFGWQSEIGAFLDAFADKLLLIGTYAALGFRGELPAWLVAVVVTRDALIMGSVALQSWLTGRVRVRPLMAGKVNTAAQVLLAILVIADEALGLGLEPLRGVLVYAIAATAVYSAWAYLRASLGARGLAGTGAGDGGAVG